MTAAEKVLVAMSGGVDSTMTAVRLLEQGHEVIGATMRLWETGSDAACADARKAARTLGIAHHVVDFRAEFREQIVDPFIEVYCAGRTPNPCVQCNREVKFGWLAEFGRSLGADRIATGHYARIEPDREQGRFVLKRGVDGQKDQSYFLFRIPAAQLSRISFPLGGLTKDAVRAMAARKGLSVAQRPESQDICFIPEGGYESLIRRERPDAFEPGPIRDRGGSLLGRHRGLPAYTVGQRKGLGIASSEPYYVLALDREDNSLIVGRKDELREKAFALDRLNWCSIPPPEESFDAMVQIRYRSTPAGARIFPRTGGGIHVEFTGEQPAITPGQSAVFYDGDTVLGGGRITDAL